MKYVQSSTSLSSGDAFILSRIRVDLGVTRRNIALFDDSDLNGTRSDFFDPQGSTRAAYMDPARFARLSRMAFLKRLRAYIRPRSVGRHPRALMEFALSPSDTSSASSNCDVRPSCPSGSRRAGLTSCAITAFVLQSRRKFARPRCGTARLLPPRPRDFGGLWV